MFNFIKKRINKKEREEIEFLVNDCNQYVKENEAYLSAIINNRLAIHDTVDDLVNMGILTEKDRRKFYKILDDRYGYQHDPYRILEKEGLL